MRQTAVVLLLSALFVGLGLVTASPAVACSCAGGTTAQYFDGADAVFTGRLVSREVGGLGPISSSGDPALHVFAVDTVFKGDVHERQGVVSAASGASCGLELSGEGPFVVFADRSPEVADDGFAANLCGGTAPVTPEIENELQALADPGAGPAGQVPLPGAAGTATTGTGLLPPALAVAAAAVFLLVGGLLLRRRRHTA